MRTINFLRESLLLQNVLDNDNERILWFTLKLNFSGGNDT